ncbi:MAG: molybdopterin adenylyltransferase [Euryarchaeota archaeon]|nr:molybdopterin adenylyltransferase [Euryarchaeota archaeon]
MSGKDNSCGDNSTLGIITVSDRASKGEYEDEGGPAILQFFEQALASSADVIYRCIPDDLDTIKQTMIEFADEIGCDIIITTGGTGPAKRDVTPDATISVCDRILDGFGEQMRMISLKYVPTAILSRQVGGTRGSCLIFNLPGRPKAIRETIDEIWKAVPYCVDLLQGPYIDMNDEICNSFRPPDSRRR